MASRGRAQSQVVVEYLGHRPAMKNQSLVGSVTASSKFDDTRRSLGESLSEAVKTILQEGNMGNSSTKSRDNDDKIEREYMFRSLKQFAITSAILQTGAVSVGCLTVFMDLLDPVYGISASSGLMTAGIGTYWFGSKTLAQQYQQKWSNRAKMLQDAMDTISTNELERVNRRILDGVAPYSRFVETEQERLDQLQEDCQGVSTAAKRLRNQIGKLIS